MQNKDKQINLVPFQWRNLPPNYSCLYYHCSFASAVGQLPLVPYWLQYIACRYVEYKKLAAQNNKSKNICIEKCAIFLSQRYHTRYIHRKIALAYFVITILYEQCKWSKTQISVQAVLLRLLCGYKQGQS